MRKHGGTPSRRDKHFTLAAISPPGVARGRFVGGHQSGLAGCTPPPLFTRGTSSCSSQGRRQGEPWGASPRPSAPTYLPTWYRTHVFSRNFCLFQCRRTSHVWLPKVKMSFCVTLRAMAVEPVKPVQPSSCPVVELSRKGGYILLLSLRKRPLAFKCRRQCNCFSLKKGRKF